MKPALFVFLLFASLASAEPLPKTEPLNWLEEDLSERLMDGAHAFVERQIAESKEKRAAHWNYDFTSPEAYVRSIAPNRERFRTMIGVVDERASPVRMEKFGDDENPALVAETNAFRVFQARWPVLNGFFGEGLITEPIEKSLGVVIALPDVGQTPEQLLRLEKSPQPRSFSNDGDGSTFDQQLIHELAREYTLVIPALINREIYLGETGDDPRLKRANQTHREWIYRQTFHMGRHLIGYEVQTILAVVDWAERVHPDGNICITGAGDGGMIALFATASDQRIDAADLRGYVGPLDEIWREPIDRNLFGVLNEFGPMEVISLVAPRLVFIARENPMIPERDPATTPPDKGEIPEILPAIGDLAGNHPFYEWYVVEVRKMGFDGEGAGHPSRIARFFDDLDQWFGNPGITTELSAPAIKDRRKSFKDEERHRRLFTQLERHVQALVRASNGVREEFYLNQAEPQLEGGKWSTDKAHPTLDPAGFIEKSKEFRRRFHEEAIGKFDQQLLAANPSSRKILETDDWTAWDVVLDVYPEFFAWGVLILPKDIKPDEKRPVVVCQHGRNGIPRDLIDGDKTAYNDFAARLAERGFITFVPHNLYRGEDRYRWLDRKANSVGCTLFSFIIPSHRQILTWLKTQPNVDPERIAFYGLSYGGETAVRVPPVLEDYAVTICSGDFNQWTRKVAATDFPGGFMQSIEWEMPYWNLGHTFDYAEMAYLIFPRPFMVERGHHDRVSRDHWVAHEYAKVRWLYAQFGMADRTEIEYFQGGHSINGQGSFDFLHKHLNWPKP